MVSFRTVSSLLCAVALGSYQVEAYGGGWHLDKLVTLVNERLDPLISPNGVASHMHKIYGGSAFGASYSPSQASGSKCTSAAITIDKSNYWVPQLYWINDDASGSDGAHTFTVIPATARFYYWLVRPASQPGPVTAFPPGFRMIAGNPNNKDQVNTGYFGFNCFNTAGVSSGDDFNFDRNCGTVQTIINFPSCWDGMNLYAADQSHVRYPSGGLTGDCPYSHPVKIPAIHFEVSWQLSQIGQGNNTGTAGKLAWANGDTTGMGVHADFTNGWDVGILQKALNEPSCSLTSDAITIQSCSVLAPYYNIGTADSCKPDKGIMAEQYSNADKATVKVLPGCNPLWGNTTTKPICASPASTPSVTAWTGSSSYTTVYNTTSPWPTDTSGNWLELGCFKSQTSVIGGPTYTDFNNLTPATCQAYCGGKGYKYAGISTANCYCGTSIDTTQSLTLDCTSKCSGNSSETCGAPYRSEVWFNSAPANATSTNPAYKGCYQDTAAHRLAQLSFTDAAMTPQVCREGCAEASPSSELAGVTGNTCYCGTSTQLGTATNFPDASCTTKCPGNSTQICGSGTQVLSVYTIDATYKASVAANLPSVYKEDKFVGCYYGGSNGAAVTNLSYIGGDVTPAVCIALCTTKGFSITGLINGNQCRCGNAFQIPTYLTPSRECDLPCAGDSTKDCGGTSMHMSVYNSTATAAASDFEGCYKSSSTAYPIGGPSFSSNSMTNKLCKAGCADWGYAYASTNVNSCMCGNTLTNSGGGVTVTSQCSQKCGGNSTDFCGGPYRWSVYNTKATTPDAFPSGYAGCYLPTTSVGMLTAQSVTQTNTAASCVASCKALGYQLAGTQGTACACGNTLGGTPKRIGDPLCSTVCSGSSSELCGYVPSSGYRGYSIYNTNGTSTYASAAAAGASSSVGSSAKAASAVASSSASTSSAKTSSITSTRATSAAVTASTTKPASAITTSKTSVSTVASSKATSTTQATVSPSTASATVSVMVHNNYLVPVSQHSTSTTAASSATARSARRAGHRRAAGHGKHAHFPRL